MIGALKHRIYIVRRHYKTDDYGGLLYDYESKRPAWAAVKSAQGTETMVDGAVDNSKTATFIIRKTQISASDFIEKDGEVWNISNIEALDDKPFYLLVSCRKNKVTGA